MQECIQKDNSVNFGMRHPNEFSMKECLTEIYAKLDSPLKRKERP